MRLDAQLSVVRLQGPRLAERRLDGPGLAAPHLLARDGEALAPGRLVRPESDVELIPLEPEVS